MGLCLRLEERRHADAVVMSAEPLASSLEAVGVHTNVLRKSQQVGVIMHTEWITGLFV